METLEKYKPLHSVWKLYKNDETDIQLFNEAGRVIAVDNYGSLLLKRVKRIQKEQNIKY